jgi:hypothetical protein
MIEGRNIKEDFEFFRDLVYPVGGVTAKKIWIEGNHEERLREYVNKNPQMSELANCPSILSTMGINDLTYVATGKLWTPPDSKVSFTHGQIVLSGSGNLAKKLTDAYHRSVRAGHIHSYMVWTERVAADSEDYHTGMVCPPDCMRNLPYAKNKPSSNQQGFLIGEYDCVTGKFCDQVILSINGEFVYNGKRY